MRDERTILTISKNTEFGYTEMIQFITDRHAQGGVEYYLKGYEKWEDGHKTEMPNLRYLKVTKEYGNTLFKQYIADGYTIIDKVTFQPTQMDMR